MRRIALCAALLCAPAFAQQTMIARDGNDSVTITDKPCHADVIRAVPEAKGMRAALASVGGKSYKACWEMRGAHVFLRYEDKDAGLVPVGQFKESPGA